DPLLPGPRVDGVWGVPALAGAPVRAGGATGGTGLPAGRVGPPPARPAGGPLYRPPPDEAPAGAPEHADRNGPLPLPRHPGGLGGALARGAAPAPPQPAPAAAVAARGRHDRAASGRRGGTLHG